MKKTICSIIIMALVVVLLAACATTQNSSTTETQNDSASSPVESIPAEPQKTYKIGFTNSSDDTIFCKQVRDCLVEIVEGDPAISIITADGKNDVAAQIDQINTFIVQECDFIVAIPVDGNGIVPAVEAANQAGIPFITILVKAEGGITNHVGTNAYEAGEKQAEYLSDLLPQNGTYVYLEGLQGQTEGTQRFAGFQETMEKIRPDAEMLSHLAANWMRDQAMDITEDWIQAYEHFDAVVTANDEMTLGAIQALKTANRIEGVTTYGVDAIADACNAIKAGDMTMSLYQDKVAEAQQVYDNIKKLIAGEELGETSYVPFTLVDANNVQEFLDMYAAE